MNESKITVGLAGNPNSGKSSIFNALTGARQHIGNYPGVTVEKKEGFRRYNGYEIKFVDLPGTYSLTAYSIEEVAARNFITDEHPDVVVHIVDSSNYERNLYLATQLLEMNIRLILAFNMSDIARQRGIEFNLQKLARFFHCPIVPTVGNKAKGIDELLKSIVLTVKNTSHDDTSKIINYGTEIEKELEEIEQLIDREHRLAEKYGPRWLAIKLLEQDKEILDKGHSKELIEAVAHSIERIR
jgi:ferrous iron transport protein B